MTNDDKKLLNRLCKRFESLKSENLAMKQWMLKFTEELIELCKDASGRIPKGVKLNPRQVPLNISAQRAWCIVKEMRPFVKEFD